jgi:2-hydroxy-3-keto-5-methylthiopentenyl-1-phosphate phosphatase
MTHSSPNNPIRLFIDFDGTLTHTDVGDLLFRTFLSEDKVEEGWHNDIIARWKSGELSSEVCLTAECDNTRVTPAELDALLDTIPITGGFVEAAEYCRRNDIPLMVLSDGLDYYIEYVLAKFGLSDVAYRANTMTFREDGSLGVTFPHINRECGICGNCKESHIIDGRCDGETVVYVGDGYSDRYAITRADVIFARRDLADYCSEHKISYIPFESFHPVLTFLKERYG